MKKRKAFEKAADSAAEYVVNAMDDIKEGARSMVDEASKGMHNVRAATETAWSEVESKANTLQSDGVTQVRRHPLGSVAVIIGAILLVSLIVFFLRPERE